MADKIEAENQSNNQLRIPKFDLPFVEETGYFKPLYLYQSFWCNARILPNIISFQNQFEAQNTDIILASKPKSGTTWLKSLVYSIIHRTNFTNSNHPLLHKNPHQLISHFEFDIYDKEIEIVQEYLTNMKPPRLFATHIPYTSLAESIKVSDSNCKIVYIARNPFDTVVSSWKFSTQVKPELEKETSFEDFVGEFCRGVEPFGPHWEHVLGYWNESLERPDKVLFLKYEDMQENGVLEMKKLAQFLGSGFSLEEETKGVIEEMLKFCGIKKLKNLEVNKTGSYTSFGNKEFFGKGEVGDWVNHFTPEMVEKMKQVMKDKFGESGLEFKVCLDKNK